MSPVCSQKHRTVAGRPGQTGFVARDAQLLMTWPFFSLSKSPRVQPIDLKLGARTIWVEAGDRHGMATIWDADILIWIISNLVAARKDGRTCSSCIHLCPHQLLLFARRGTGRSSYSRLKAALHRLATTRTTITGILPEPVSPHPGMPFAWIRNWEEQIDKQGRSHGIALEIADLLYEIAVDPRNLLTIDPRYFSLTGGLERWLYRMVRKHGGRQPAGWCFELRHLHRKSGSRSTFQRFAFDIRALVQRQSLPGYRLSLENGRADQKLRFWPSACLASPPPFPRQTVDKL